MILTRDTSYYQVSERNKKQGPFINVNSSFAFRFKYQGIALLLKVNTPITNLCACSLRFISDGLGSIPVGASCFIWTLFPYVHIVHLSNSCECSSKHLSVLFQESFVRQINTRQKNVHIQSSQ